MSSKKSTEEFRGVSEILRDNTKSVMDDNDIGGVLFMSKTIGPRAASTIFIHKVCDRDLEVLISELIIIMGEKSGLTHKKILKSIKKQLKQK